MTKSGKRKVLLSTLAVMTAWTTVACSSGSGTTPTTTTTPSPDKAPVKVVMWHYMGGNLGKTIDQMTESFNASRKDIKVEAIYQGSYDEALNKMKASMDSKTGPTIMQANDGGTRYMVDSKAITPMQNFIKEDKYDLSQFEENILAYYTLDNQLNSMPFNTSNLIMYYNKNLFKAAGLDPEKPPATYDEIKSAAQAMTKNSTTGIAFSIESWNMEQLLANQGVEFVNNGNGRTSPATESIINSEAAINTLTWWKGLIDSKVGLNMGRKVDDIKKAFAAEQLGIIFATTASMREIVTNANGKFEVGTAFLPKPNNAKEGGVVVGGGSLYIMNNQPKDAQQAAWEFIKYMLSPEQQALWHINTGYFPVTKKAYEQPIVKENMTKFPQFKTAIDQLHATKINKATQGAVIGVFPETRQLVENAIEDALSGKRTPKEALDAAAQSITTKIAIYNKTVGK
ncbi:sn-glycerol 3-phosphate transport system substrate-binding protein [Paenibacillus sp. 1_12]|uniref:ABC transporter substrate-binding protein n=1 Tax=Paenibacillus sp. 1_12 TaxID=1566278 RepID=UPI0008E3B7B2|nr:ABC transporter substrate-binding protein [Paenibacillus sp. 1_12]SFM30573.1 sn-glycerol 3-phosphate transport system substrate-binding protein [Paenibacillus sp. 1_12]